MFAHPTLRTILGSLAIVVVGVLPLSAQEGSPGRGSAVVEHAEIGRLEAMGRHNDRIVIGRPPDNRPYGDDVHWSFATDSRTRIQGLGDVMNVDEIPQDAMGSVAIVTFVPGGDQGPVARRVYFPVGEEIRVTHGRITGIDREDHVLFLETPGGSEERFNIGLGPGATIDSNRGLLSASDLRAGQEITIYHSHRGGPVFDAGVAAGYLVFVYDA